MKRLSQISCDDLLNSRNGFSLIEMVLVIGVNGLILTVISSIFVICYQADSKVGRQLQTMRTNQAYATVFRDDVHAHDISRIKIEKEQKRIVFTNRSSEPSITYSWEQNFIVRKDSKTRESYRFSKGTRFSWNLDQKSKMVTALIDQPIEEGMLSRSGDRLYRTDRFEALSGRHISSNERQEQSKREEAL